MGLTRAAIETLIAGGSGSGGFHADVFAKVDLTFDPIPTNDTLSIATGIILAPPAGQFVFVPMRIEYISKSGSGGKGVGMALGLVHFTNAIDTPNNRADAFFWSHLYQPPTFVLQVGIAVDGELSVIFLNQDVSNPAWARASLIVAQPMVTIAGP